MAQRGCVIGRILRLFSQHHDIGEGRRTPKQQRESGGDSSRNRRAAEQQPQEGRCGRRGEGPENRGEQSERDRPPRNVDSDVAHSAGVISPYVLGNWRSPITVPSRSLTVATNRPLATSRTSCTFSAPPATSCSKAALISVTVT